MLNQPSAVRAVQTGRAVRTSRARRTGAPAGSPAPAGAARSPAAHGMPVSRNISTAGAVRGGRTANARPAPYPARPASNPPYPGRPAPYPAQRPASARPSRPESPARLARRRARRRRQMLRRRLAMLVILAVTAGLLAAWEPWAHLPDALAKPANALLALTGLRVLPAAADAGTRPRPPPPRQIPPPRQPPRPRRSPQPRPRTTASPGPSGPRWTSSVPGCPAAFR